jgi:hypothetical protein
MVVVAVVLGGAVGSTVAGGGVLGLVVAKLQN